MFDFVVNEEIYPEQAQVYQKLDVTCEIRDNAKFIMQNTSIGFIRASPVHKLLEISRKVAQNFLKSCSKSCQFFKKLPKSCSFSVIF